MADIRKPLHRYIAPKYWPAWLGLGLLRIVCWLPQSLLLGIGRLLGKLTYQVAGERRAIVARNLEPGDFTQGGSTNHRKKNNCRE